MKYTHLVALLLLICNCSESVSADEQKGVLPVDENGKALNLDFETGTLADWTQQGNAFEQQPIRGDTVVKRRPTSNSKHQGEFWIGGYEKLEDSPKGTLTSKLFLVTHPYASFLFNGGSHSETRVELVLQKTGSVFYKRSGTNRENMQQIVVDLRAQRNQQIFIRLVDDHSGGWGHINFDNFRFHAKRPAAVTPVQTPLVLDEYPHKGLAAKDAVRHMTLPKGFNVQLCASEPDIKQPIAMAIDERGRLWVAEAYEYPLRAKGETGRDRILIFEDTTGDGKLDSRKVFADGLNLISGLEVGFGGVWVGAAPYLLFIPDANRDDKPDGKPQVLLDGWGYQDTHETLNAFIWGPDGWLYGCHGVFTHSRVGKPGTPDDKRIPLNAAIWRYHPTRHEFDVFAHGTSNPWGVDFNDHGQAFCTACVIPHLFHIIQNARYQRQAGQHFNPHTYQDITTIADHLHYLGHRPHAGNSRSDAVGGGHAHAGAMIYLGGSWPEKYRNQIFMNNIHGQRLNMDLLRAQGSGYVGEHGPDFLLTGDKASQMLNFRYGPDGQAYIIDWYDMQACHSRNASVHDRSNGRIYKVNYGKPAAIRIDLNQQSDLQLAELMLHKNDWYVRHARKVLQHRAATRQIENAAVKRLTDIAVNHKDETRRLRGMWALHVTGNLTADLIEDRLGDSNAYVRGWAIQLLLEDKTANLSSALLTRFKQMAADDKSQVVRLYLASALQELPLQDRWDILSALVTHKEDAADHNLPHMYWYAAEPLANTDPKRAIAFALDAGAAMPHIRNSMLRRIASSDNPEALASLVEGLGAVKQLTLQHAFLDAIRTALRGRRQVTPPANWSRVFAKLLEGDPDLKPKASALAVTFGDQLVIAEFRIKAASGSVSNAERRLAVNTLLAYGDKHLAPILHMLIENTDLRETAIRGLAQYDHEKTPSVLLQYYPKLSSVEKRLVMATLCARPQYALELLTAIRKKQIAAKELPADLARQLSNLNHKEVDQLLASVWGTVRQTPAEKARIIADFKKLLASKPKLEPDLALGRAVFAKTCQQCHLLYGRGGKVGPDITGSNRSNLEYLLSNLVDPSAVMAKEYRPSVILTADGRVITGIIKKENSKSITVQTATEAVIVPKEEIELRKLSDKSMMPENQLKLFNMHEVRSLMAYLTRKAQVPILARHDNTSLLFNGKNLTGWTGDAKLWRVENGVIIGRSPGLKKNEFLISDLTTEDFHFRVEVKLVDNVGNSGIQFRSQPIPNGLVRGYQADIGVGWWGKLYEEHGRGLLWKQSGEKFIKTGEWNTYEIKAVGHRVETWINGHKSVDLADPKGALRGQLALQLHSGGPMEIHFRNLQLKVLPENTKSAVK